VPESGPLGSVRGDRGNPVPYRDTSDNASKLLCDIETGAVPLFREERGGNLPTGHVVSGV
jgi:hypothetical protein